MIKLKDGVTSVEVQGSCIVVDPTTGRYMAANSVAYHMMAGIAAGKTIDEIILDIRAIYDVDSQTIATAFEEFQQRLIALDLVAKRNG